MAGQLLQRAWGKTPASKLVPHPLPEKLFNPHSYVKGHFLSPKNAKRDSHWKWSEPKWDNIPGRKRGRYLGKPLLHSDKSGSKVSMKFEGRAIGAFVLAGPAAGTLAFELDGTVKGTIDLRHRYSRGLHYPRTVMFAHDLEPGVHHLTLTLLGGGEGAGKATAARILQFCVN